MATKVLTVATEVQKAIFEQVLRQEIATGFWKNGRPADHADSWKGVEVIVGAKFGPSGFEVPRNYNFVNPSFYEKTAKRILDAAQAVDANVTEKQVKKQLINLNLIVGGRIKEQGGEITKLPRGRAKADPATASAPKTASKTAKATVRRAAAVIAPEQTEEATS